MNAIKQFLQTISCQRQQKDCYSNKDHAIPLVTVHTESNIYGKNCLHAFTVYFAFMERTVTVLVDKINTAHT